MKTTETNTNFLLHMFWHLVLPLGVIQSILVSDLKREGDQMYLCLESKCADLWAHINFMQEGNIPQITWSCHVFLTALRLGNCHLQLLIVGTIDKIDEALVVNWPALHRQGNSWQEKKRRVWLPQNNLNQGWKLYNQSSGSRTGWIVCFHVKMYPAEQISFDSSIKWSI